MNGFPGQITDLTLRSFWIHQLRGLTLPGLFLIGCGKTHRPKDDWHEGRGFVIVCAVPEAGGVGRQVGPGEKLQGGRQERGMEMASVGRKGPGKS